MMACPTPRSPESGLKLGPCGGVYANGAQYTQISPGPFPIVFEEAIFHSGAPFRIALSGPSATGSIPADSFEQCILLNHIPHNDRGTANQFYVITVNIPDVNCSACALQVIQVMTDKMSLFSPGSSSCTYDPADTVTWTGGKCGSNYHSCANVIINGTKQFDAATVCPSQASGWPYNLSTYVYAQGEGAVWQNSLLVGGNNYSLIPVGTACTAFAISAPTITSSAGTLSAGAVVGIIAATLIVIAVAVYAWHQCNVRNKGLSLQDQSVHVRI